MKNVCPSMESLAVALVGWFALTGELFAADHVRDLQAAAVEQGKSPVGHWGSDPQSYVGWFNHTNRLVPVYTFGTRGSGTGIDLETYTGANSAYRSAAGIRRIYGKLPTNTLNPTADYMDQTDVAAIQRAAFAAGRKHIILFIFDGMDWQTTRAAAIYNEGKVGYAAGRGTGTHFQNYTAAGTTQFGFMVTTPHNEGTKTDVNTQRVLNPGGQIPGGYNPKKGGPNPWTAGDDLFYPMGKSSAEPLLPGEHAFPDSAATATAMTSGVKTFNNAMNVDVSGAQVSTIALEVQATGIVSSVPFSHATPGCAAAHNVDRDDFQDLSRDMLGLPSISHPDKPLPGLDVVIGGSYGVEAKTESGQGLNFVPGNAFITTDDLKAIDATGGGRYIVAQRTADVSGSERLHQAAREAAQGHKRLFGFYGIGKAKGHLPFQTADGDYQPAPGRTKLAERYTPADLKENPTLAQMTSAALTVLDRNPKGFWLMVEAGDVDWANHDNNLDNSIGAVNSGDEAVKTITDWVEQHSNWKETLLIVTADHGHYLVLDKPELLCGPSGR